MGYDNERWVELYSDALAELEHFKIRGRIGDARAGIATRVEELKRLPGLHGAELQAIDNALYALRFLEREEDRYDEIERLRALEMATLNL
jgi:hypothetical protein